MSASDQPRPPVPPPTPSSEAPGAPAPGAPASPPAKPWWQRGWGAAAIGVVGLLVGAGAGVGIAASGHTKTVTTANTTTVTAASTAPAAGAGHAPAHAENHTVTRTVTNTVTRTTLEPAHTVAPKPTTFSGNGRKNLGTVTIPHESAIEWHASGGHFYLKSIPEGQALEVKETGTSGKAVITNGTFEHLEVIANGPWSFTVTPHG